MSENANRGIASEHTSSGRDSLDALKAAVDRTDWEAASAAVRSGWFPLVSEHGEATRVLLERAPVPALRSQPLLAMMLGLIYNTMGYHRVRALRYFVIAVRAARAPRNLTLNPVDRALIRSAEAAAYRLLGRLGMAAKAAQAAVEALDRLSDEERSGVRDLPRMYAQVGISLYYSGDTDRALETFAKGLAETPTTPPSSGFGNLAMTAGIHAFQGELPEARAAVEYARIGPWNDRQRSMYTGTFYRLAEAVLALEAFDAAAARAHLDALVHDRKTIEHWIAEAEVEAAVGLVEGQPGKALAGLEAYVSLRGAEGRSATARGRLARTRSLLQLALGNPDAAAAIVERDAPPGPLRHIEQARVDLSLERTGSALNQLKLATAQHLTPRAAAEAAALEAAILTRFPPTARSRGVVDHLGALLERTEQRLAVTLLPSSDFTRVTDALRHAGYSDLVESAPLRALLTSRGPDLLLSSRELAVLARLLETGSIAEIASALVVSSNTVKTQLRSIYRKLGVTNREDAIAVALDRHLLVERD
ncbi:response regulator transcription factor [Leifsonia sp. 2TAF2]|uniref:helix-turn-helix transcriptional regulator n=1 Tax=Leifsonia sp. 2TAF2 TaxID=3233009 RepID=UPI003F9BC2DA